MSEIHPHLGVGLFLFCALLYPAYRIWTNSSIMDGVLYDPRDAACVLFFFKAIYSSTVAFVLFAYFQGVDRATSLLTEEVDAFIILIISYAWMSFIVYSVVHEGNYGLSKFLFILFGLPVLDAVIIGLVQMS